MPYAFNEDKTKYDLAAELAKLAALDPLRHHAYTLQPEIPLEFTGNNVRGILIATGASLTRHAVYTFYSNSSGVFYAKEVVGGGLISVDTTGGSMTVSNTAAYGQSAAYLDVLVMSSNDIA